jgi:antitoxin CcdA
LIRKRFPWFSLFMPEIRKTSGSHHGHADGMKWEAQHGHDSHVLRNVRPQSSVMTQTNDLGQAHKRPVNLTLSEALVEPLRADTSHLPATMETLLANHVAGEVQAVRSRHQQADACAADWNALHDSVGSFADEHSTL